MFLNQKTIDKDYLLGTKKFGIFFYILLIFSLYSNTLPLSNFARLLFANVVTLTILVFNFDLIFKNKSYFKFLVFTGNISYSLYLFHQGVLAGIRNHNHYATFNSSLYLDLNNCYV